MGSHDHKRRWLITGGSSGLGLAITLAVLRAGDAVIATGRNIADAARNHPEVEELGGTWLALDVKSENTEHVVAEAIRNVGGSIDVVVNNAGTLLLTSIEDARMNDIRDMFETHVLGAVRVLKGVLPFFRAQKSGTIINMSSFSGLTGTPGAGVYCLCKFALEGLSESLERELAPFNIRVVILEPGGFRTTIMQKATDVDTDGIGSHYLDTAVGDTIRITRDMAERPLEMVGGDPTKFAQRVLEIVHGTGEASDLGSVLRFPFGNDSLDLCNVKIERLLKDFKMTQNIAQSANIDGFISSGGQGL